MFAQLLDKPVLLNHVNPQIELTRKMGGVYALSEPSRDTNSIQVAAKHDFNVTMSPVQLPDGRLLPGKCTAINDNTSEMLGGNVVGDGYNPLQPDELYSLADHLLSLDQSMQITDVVSMNNLIGIQLNKGEWSPTGEIGDILKNNILLLTTFDGSKPTSMRTISFRPTCSNQYGGSKKVFSIRHTRNSDIRLNELKRLLSNITIEIQNTAADIQSLVYKSMTNGQATQFFNDLLLNGKQLTDLTPRAKTGHDNKISDFERLLNTGAGCDAGRGTRYAAFNALTNYCTHERTTRVATGANESQIRWESNLFGSAADFASNGFNQLVNM